MAYLSIFPNEKEEHLRLKVPFSKAEGKNVARRIQTRDLGIC